MVRKLIFSSSIITIGIAWVVLFDYWIYYNYFDNIVLQSPHKSFWLSVCRSVSVAFNVWLAVNQILVEQVRVSIRSQVKIFFDYVDEQQRTSARTVWPFALGYFNDKIVLAAWCELRNDFRNFRLDRMQNLSLSQERYPQFKQQLFQQWWTQEVCRSTTEKNWQCERLNFNNTNKQGNIKNGT